MITNSGPDKNPGKGASPDPAGAPVRKLLPASDGPATSLPEKYNALNRWNALLRGRGAVSLNILAKDLEPVKDSLTPVELGELAQGLMVYFLSAFRRGQFRDLDGLEKLGYLVKNTQFVPDEKFLQDLRFLYHNLGPYAIEDIYNKVVGTDGYTQEERRKESPQQTANRYREALSGRLKDKLDGREVDGCMLSLFLDCSSLLTSFYGGSANLIDLAEDNPKLAALIVLLSEQLAGEILLEMRQSLGVRSRVAQLLSTVDSRPNSLGSAPQALIGE